MDLLSNRRKIHLYREPFWRRRWFRWGLASVTMLTVGGTIGALLFLKPFYDRAQEFDLRLIDDLPVASVIYDRHGEEIGRIFDDENRELVTLDDVPFHLVQALMAAEDSRYFEHQGVDYIGITRAVFLNLKAGETTQGASTITQQLARNAYGLTERSVNRKLTEAFLARRIERHFTKQEILELYLNRIFFGPGAYGVRSAARRYFGKDPRDLSIEECATICGLIKSPVRLSPLRNPEESLKARNYVLDRMREEGMITLEDLDDLQAKPLVTHPDPLVTRYPYVYEEVRGRLMEMLPEEEVKRGGFHIYTTVDAGLQRVAEQSLRRSLDAVEERVEYQGQTYAEYERIRQEAVEKGEDPPLPRYLQGAVLTIDNSTGGILAMVGGRDYAHSKFNAALQARRASGTGFLPFLYAAAFENGANPTTEVADDPMDANRVMIGGLVGILGEWGVESSVNVHEGAIPARRALANSKLGASFRLGQTAGLGKIVDLARRAGIRITDEKARLPATMLGQAETTLGEYCLAYTIFPGQGRRPPGLQLIRRVVDADGKEVLRIDPRSEQLVEVIDPLTAFQTWSCLVDALEVGTGAKARARYGLEGGPFAGKTSTSYGFTDNWFLGGSAKVTTGVWCGFNRPESIFDGAFSNDTVLPAWVEVMEAVSEDREPVPLPPPSQAKRVEMCRLSGKPAGEYCYDRVPDPAGGKPTFVRSTYFEHLRPGTTVEGVCDRHQRDSDLLAEIFSGEEADVPEEAPGFVAEAVIPTAPILLGKDPYQSEVPVAAVEEEEIPEGRPVAKPRVVDGDQGAQQDRLATLPRPGRLALEED